MSTTPTAAVARLTTRDFQRLLAIGSDLTVIDVRTPGEYQTIHIDASQNLPLTALRERTPEIARTLRGPVVLLCGSGSRSDEAARILLDYGLSDVSILEGGIARWESAGGDVVRGHGTWAIERQVRLVAGAVVLGGIVTSTILPKAKWLAAGIGGGLAFSAITNTCAMGRVLGMAPYNRRAGTFDTDAAIAGLSR